MDRKHSGSHKELIACAWLLSQGYEVFRNVSAHGEIDVVGIKGECIFQFDVKSPGVKIKDKQIPMGIILLYVHPNGHCEIDYRPDFQRMFACKFCFKIFKSKGKGGFCSSECKKKSAKSVTRFTQLRVKKTKLERKKRLTRLRRKWLTPHQRKLRPSL